jgi:hypothetical protein
MNPTTILADLWADGVAITLAPDNANLVAPANRLTQQQRDFIKAHKPALIDFLVATQEITTAAIAAAMKRCDQFGDNAAAREQMRLDVLAVPPHLHADLLDHFKQCR